VKTFDAINATMASVTGVSPNTPTVHTAFSNVRQSLPAVPSIQAFLSSHQTSIAQLAITYCAALTDDTAARASYFPGLDFVGGFSSAGQRNALINPLIDRVFGNAASQPDANTVRTELDALVTRLCPSDCTGARTATVVKSVCGAAVGNAATLVH
jgi:outer membrane protein TolC